MMQARVWTAVLAACVALVASENMAVVLLQVNAEPSLPTAPISAHSASLRSVASIAQIASRNANLAAKQLSKAAEAPVIVRAQVTNLGNGDRNRLFKLLGETQVVFQDRDGSARLFPAPKLEELVTFIANTRNISTSDLQSRLIAKGVTCPMCNKDTAVEKVIDLYLNGPEESTPKVSNLHSKKMNTTSFKLGSSNHGQKHAHKANVQVLKQTVHKVSDRADKVQRSRDLFEKKSHAHKGKAKGPKHGAHQAKHVAHTAHAAGKAEAHKAKAKVSKHGVHEAAHAGHKVHAAHQAAHVGHKVHAAETTDAEKANAMASRVSLLLLTLSMFTCVLV